MDALETPPDFRLLLASGDTLTRADLTARRTVLFFFPRADTPGCTAEAIDFSRLVPAFRAADVGVFGVSADEPPRLLRFAAKHAIEVPLASAGEEALRAFGVWVEKSLYGRRFMGIERSTFLIGADGLIERSWRKVKVPGHAAEVLASVA